MSLHCVPGCVHVHQLRCVPGRRIHDVHKGAGFTPDQLARLRAEKTNYMQVRDASKELCSRKASTNILTREENQQRRANKSSYERHEKTAQANQLLTFFQVCVKKEDSRR